MPAAAARATARIAARGAVARWLLLCCALLAVLICVGGITRLTRSGLSIPNWRPLTGVLPPIGESAWERAFAEYRDTPEFKIVHPDMTLTEYRRIYAWEFVHRLLARALGLAFAVPLVYFAWRRLLPRGFGRRLAVILALGALQGFVGWWMVASGLAGEPRVSHVRLAVHLGLALLLLAAMLHAALDLLLPLRAASSRGARVWFGRALVGALFLQALGGAVMAGSRAGYLYPTFPRMAGELVPARLFALRPWPASLVFDLTTIHFVHRWSGIAIALLAAAGWFASLARPTSRAADRASGVVASLAVAAAGLGVATVTTDVTSLPAGVHQMIAVTLLGAAIVAGHLAAAAAAPARVSSGERREV